MYLEHELAWSLIILIFEDILYKYLILKILSGILLHISSVDCLWYSFQNHQQSCKVKWCSLFKCIDGGCPSAREFNIFFPLSVNVLKGKSEANSFTILIVTVHCLNNLMVRIFSLNLCENKVNLSNTSEIVSAQ